MFCNNSLTMKRKSEEWNNDQTVTATKQIKHEPNENDEICDGNMANTTDSKKDRRNGKAKKNDKQYSYNVEEEINNEEELISSSTLKLEDSDNEEHIIKTENEETPEAVDESNSMTKEDQCILLQRLQSCIPMNDSKNYSYRLNHVNWENVIFKNYTAEDCKNEWLKIMKNVRHYRLLSEIITDVRNMITRSCNTNLINQTTKECKRHPDMPKKPLSSYFIFYLKKKDNIARKHPGSDASTLSKIIGEKYSKLSSEKKRKYEQLAARNKQQYEQDLKNFYNLHPEYLQRKLKKKKDTPPKKPDTPYNLFIKSELLKEVVNDRDKSEFKHFCKEKWLHMPEEKKVVWINLAEEHNEKYQEELKNYIETHPTYAPKTSTKSVISKKDAELKDKLAGKPKKPPSTAYSFFVSEVLQSPEISGIPIKERMQYCSGKWKQTTQEEKKKYRQMLQEAHIQYDRNYELYLNSLSEEKRKTEVIATIPKQKKTCPPNNCEAVSTTENRPENLEKSLLISPPKSLVKYFASKYEGDSPKEAWNALNRSEKKAYKKEWILAQSEYLKQYESYLKSLTKEEVKAFCEKKNKQEQNDTSDSDTGDDLSSYEGSSASVD